MIWLVDGGRWVLAGKRSVEAAGLRFVFVAQYCQLVHAANEAMVQNTFARRSVAGDLGGGPPRWIEVGSWMFQAVAYPWADVLRTRCVLPSHWGLELVQNR